MRRNPGKAVIKRWTANSLWSSPHPVNTFRWSSVEHLLNSLGKKPTAQKTELGISKCMLWNLKLDMNPFQNLACNPSSSPYSHRYVCSGNLSHARLDAYMIVYIYIYIYLYLYIYIYKLGLFMTHLSFSQHFNNFNKFSMSVRPVVHRGCSASTAMNWPHLQCFPMRNCCVTCSCWRTEGQGMAVKRYGRITSKHQLIYPPGNESISHLGKRKIIFKHTLQKGYVSSQEGRVCEWNNYYIPIYSLQYFFHIWLMWNVSLIGKKDANKIICRETDWERR